MIQVLFVEPSKEGILWAEPYTQADEKPEEFKKTVAEWVKKYAMGDWWDYDKI